VARLWNKDTSLWPAEAHEAESVKNNLRWLDLPQQLSPLLQRVVSRASEIEPAGFEDIVFVTLGPANLAAEAVLQLPSARLGKRTFLLNSIDPDALRSLGARLCLEKSLFIFSSKLGKDIDNHSLFLYFFEQLKVRGVLSPAGHFVALAEENSYLEQLAGAYDFIDRFIEPPGILGRYSSLIHYSFFLAAVAGFNPSDLMERTRIMQRACASPASGEVNPAALLAACLAAAESERLDRLVFLSSKRLLPVSERMGFLVGASSCADGRGLVPIFARPATSSEMLEGSCLTICIKSTGEEDPGFGERCAKLQRMGSPVLAIELDGPEDFPAELFKWEISTALACSLLKVNPFHEPDVRERRTKTAQLLERITTNEQFPLPTVRVREAEIELYAEGETRRELSTLNMTEALRTFFELRRPEGYLALLPFMDLDSPRKPSIDRICNQLESRLRLPVSVASGPRYLHTVGQTYSDGPPKGLFLVLTANPEKDLALPGADYSFGQLQSTMAQVEFESLGKKGKHVIRLHLTAGATTGFAQLESLLHSLPRIRDAASD
jgi:transaldolase/glucose-6-phosphate isomerase